MQENSEDKIEMTGDEIVISGISGAFPKSGNIQEFMDNLYNKVDMVCKDTRWTVSDPELPKHIGKIDNINKFDAQFFKVGYKQAKVLDPMSMMVLEHAYAAIFDSGNTHATLKGKVVGVFVGSSYGDFNSVCMYDVDQYSDFKVSGTSKAMLANRLSYWMDGKGPSYSVDYACASGTAALDLACKSIRTGECDMAVVGACSLCTMPELSFNSKRSGFLCMDGKTKCYNKNGDGYVRSEAITLFLLQKAKDAMRVYAEVCHTQGAYQLKDVDQFSHLRKSEDLQNFLKDVYSNIDVNPKDIEYVEANGAAFPEADVNEAEAIASVFGRDNAVKLGCVKSNMGHSDASSGLCGLTKLCLAYHTGEIPGNLHCKEPISTVSDGKIQVITENSKFERGYSALNNFSFTGANFHVILKGHYKEKNLEKYKSNIPRIVVASGRNDSGVSKIFESLKDKQLDAEEIALLHNIFQYDIPGHIGRGYMILDTIEGSTAAISESVDYYSGVKPPLWFVYSGMGSQWAGMGADLMRIPTFAATIYRCSKVLEPKGIDLVNIITDPNNTFDDILYSFVGISCIQVGLTDVLKEMGIVPDYIVGHSLGEIACAYQDGTFSIEELMLVTYSRSKAIVESDVIEGSMAAVGVGYTELKHQCPQEIDIACHNSSESSTISGPVEPMHIFVNELTSRGIFVREVPSGKKPYHSRYIAKAAPALLRHLKEILKTPKRRSNKWISTSVPKERWDSDLARYSSADYHTNNLLSPVYFEEITSMIPSNAVVVEIAPHSLMQSIIKRSLPDCTYIPLTRRGNTNGVKYFLDAIGKLYLSGYNPKLDILYEKVEFPVSTETSMLSHLIEWEHSEDWPMAKHGIKERVYSSCRNIVFTLQDDNFKYLEGHVRNGVNVIPEAALIGFAWETLAMYKGMDYQDLSVIFKDIQFYKEVVITTEAPVRLAITISKGKHNFEVVYEDQLIMSGVVGAVRSLKFHHSMDKYENFSEQILDSQEIYKNLYTRGFNYRKLETCTGKSTMERNYSADAYYLSSEDVVIIVSIQILEADFKVFHGDFQSVLSMNLDRTNGLVKWTDNWVSFLDSLIQLNIFSKDVKGISKPKYIRSLKINVLEQVNVDQKNDYFVAQIKPTYGVTRCAGIEIEDIIFKDEHIQENMADVLDSQTFFPYYPTENIHMRELLEMNIQIIIDSNTDSKELLFTKFKRTTVTEEFDYIDQIVEKRMVMNTTICSVKFDLLKSVPWEDNKTHVFVIEKVLQDSQVLKNMLNFSTDTYILCLENKVPKMQSIRKDYDILSCMSDGKKTLILMRIKQKINKMTTSFIPVTDVETFSWVPDVYKNLEKKKRIVLVSERQPFCGTLGFIKKLKTNENNNVSVVVVDDLHAPKFDPENDLYKEQLQKNMTINILKKGQWGSYYYKSSKMLVNQKCFGLKNLVPGNAEKISWVDVPDDKRLVQVHFSGLSFKDIEKDDDCYKQEALSYGMDFSGIVNSKSKVMGLIAEGSVASRVKPDPELFWPVPGHWTLEDAATVPLAYTIRTKLEKESSVVIIDGTSSAGLASISLCLHYDCTIFTVVDSNEKKEALRRLYPQLNDKNIICSYNDFDDQILITTKGMGCDVVLNLSNSPSRQRAEKCVGNFGFFIDCCKRDIRERNILGMSYLNQDRSHISVDISNIFRSEYFRDRQLIQQYITQGIKSGVVKPLSRVVFSPVEVGRAFRVLSTNKHTGGILIRIVEPSIMSSSALKTIPRLSYLPGDALIVVCDSKDIGLGLTDKLINRGALKIVLHMKTDIPTGYIQNKLTAWSKQGVLIKLCSENLQTEQGSKTLLENAIKFGKVRGVFVVLDSKQTDNGMKEDFANAYKEHALVAENLEVASRKCIDLRHFVIITNSLLCASHEYAVSVIQGMCESRNKAGLPMLVLRYETHEQNLKSNKKTQPQTLSALFNAVETSLKLKYENVFSYDMKKEKLIEQVMETHKDGMYSFYKNVDNEEDYICSQAIQELPSLVNNGIETNWGGDDTYVILIPGFEGRPQEFKSVAERLKTRAVSIQLGPDVVADNIYDMAQYAKKQFKAKFGLIDETKTFIIVGYSFGVNVGLELAALLEREGKTGVVHCIDGSPDTMREKINKVFGKMSSDQVQNHILNHMCHLLTGNDIVDFKNHFEDRVENFLHLMKNVVSFSKEYMKFVLESACKRILMAQQYKPRIELKSQIILMKGKVETGKPETIFSDDYGLSKYTTKPIKVMNLECEHETALQDNRVSNIVNMFLDPDVLDKFNKKNRCDVYEFNC